MFIPNPKSGVDGVGAASAGYHPVARVAVYDCGRRFDYRRWFGTTDENY